MPEEQTFNAFMSRRLPEYPYGHMKADLKGSGTKSGATATWAGSASAYTVRLAAEQMDLTEPVVMQIFDELDHWCITKRGGAVPFCHQEAPTMAAVPRGERDVVTLTLGNSNQLTVSCFSPILNFARSAGWMDHFMTRYHINVEYKNRETFMLELLGERMVHGLDRSLLKPDASGNLSVTFKPTVHNYDSPSSFVHADETWDANTLFTHLNSVLLIECKLPKQYGLFDIEHWEAIISSVNLFELPATNTKASKASKNKAMNDPKDYTEAMKRVVRQGIHYCSTKGLYNLALMDYPHTIVIIIPRAAWKFNAQRILEPVTAGVKDMVLKWLHHSEYNPTIPRMTTRRLTAGFLFYNMSQAFKSFSLAVVQLPAVPRESPRKPAGSISAGTGPAAASVPGETPAAAGNARPNELSPVVEGSEPATAGSAMALEWPSPGTGAAPGSEPLVVSPEGVLPAPPPMQRQVPSLAPAPREYPGRISRKASEDRAAVPGLAVRAALEER
ncbi:hypothetical protein AURDEDRAFT_123272 [Auricularia subglabra TFB-10046 SS5]|nr:hypothetical protein AURDEDRAFT_123272 [Auricularia subglabra TFB-10046 SS5]